jgi:hypothetical protein
VAARLLGDQEKSEGRLPALVQDGELHPFDAAVVPGRSLLIRRWAAPSSLVTVSTKSWATNSEPSSGHRFEPPAPVSQVPGDVAGPLGGPLGARPMQKQSNWPRTRMIGLDVPGRGACGRRSEAWPLQRGVRPCCRRMAGPVVAGISPPPPVGDPREGNRSRPAQGPSNCHQASTRTVKLPSRSRNPFDVPRSCNATMRRPGDLRILLT